MKNKASIVKPQPDQAFKAREVAFSTLKDQNIYDVSARAKTAQQVLEGLYNNGYGSDVEISPIISAALNRAAQNTPL